MKKYKEWTNKEIAILRMYYPNGGANACAKKLCRTLNAIKSRASKIGIVTYGAKGGSKRQIIDRLPDNKAIVFCPKHGKTKHYAKHNKLRCIKCESIHFQRWYKKPLSKIKIRKSQKHRLRKPIRMYENRLRSSLYHCFKNHISFTKNLPYSSQQLYDHLETIRNKQNNRCPMCKKDYNNAGFDIDHIIPTSSATNKIELLALFNLNNLSLLCPRCNRHIKRDRIL